MHLNSLSPLYFVYQPENLDDRNLIVAELAGETG